MTRDAPPPAHSPESGSDSLAVSPVLLRDPGGGRRSALLALLAVIVVLGGAIGLARLLPDDASPNRAPDPSAAVAVASSPAAGGLAASSRPSVAPAASPGGTAVPNGTPQPSPNPMPLAMPEQVLNAYELKQALDAGDVEGRLLLVQGNLEAINLGCETQPQPLHGCVLLAIEGLDVRVDAGAAALPWHDDPAPGDYLVTVVRQGKLQYLGALNGFPGAPVALGHLTRELLASGSERPPETLFAADGWLVQKSPDTCYRSDPAATPCYTMLPFLATDEPGPDGRLRSSRGSPVGLADPFGVDPAAAVVPGPFLVTMPLPEECVLGAIAPGCAEGAIRWVVAARYDPANAVLVHVP